MSEMLLSSPYSVLLVLSFFVLFLVLAAFSLTMFERQRRTYPRAVQWIDLSERIQRKNSELAAVEQRLSELGRQVGERDHLIAEIDAMRSQLEALQLELSGLSDARAQIDEVKRQAAEAATELAKRQDELADLQKRREEASTLQEKIAKMKAELGGLPATLNADIDALKSQLSTLEAEMDERRAERGALRSQTSAAQEELSTIEERRKALLEELPALEAKAAEARTELGSLRQALPNARDQVQAAKAEETQARSELSSARRALAVVVAEAQELTARKEVQLSKIAELEAIKEGLQKEIESARPLDRDANADNAFPQEMLDDLKKPPAVLAASNAVYSKPLPEEDALHRVREHLTAHQLEYPERVINAFHTALKINDVSQLTVLAGVSGTGKSLLPRRYAEAMGMRFLPIAVEPRWDSPQDLLGFYNYIEKKFRATELARALVHLDPYNTSGLAKNSGADYSDDVMIVLLDEMNLARVEYYFSEFLSRLEARPSRFIGDEAKYQRQDSEIPIDIRGRAEGELRLYPSHNMLFVGTMNDDESTQSLSEKVLDRGNIMQFAAPDSFGEAKGGLAINRQDRRLSFKTWKGWIRASERMDHADKELTKDIISKLQLIMIGCGRPFGHRLNAAMTAYVANYPLGLSHGRGVALPLVDQIEFRILPKLRGLALDTEIGAKTMGDLQNLIRDDLDDQALAHALDDLRERQEKSGGLFNWRGLTRQAG